MRRLTLLLALAPSLSCGEGEPSGPPPPPPAPAPVPASVEVFPGALTLTAFGLNGTLSARVRDQRRRTLADVPLTWSSSAPAIATVDSAGRVTAVDNGKATIIASAGEASGEAVVTVAQQAATLELAPPDTVRTYGDTARVAARSSDVNGHAIPRTSSSVSSAKLARFLAASRPPFCMHRRTSSDARRSGMSTISRTPLRALSKTATKPSSSFRSRRTESATRS